MELSKKELEEADELAEEIASLATRVSGESYFEDHVTLDLTTDGWLSRLEDQGTVVFSGVPTKTGFKEAMISLKHIIADRYELDKESTDS